MHLLLAPQWLCCSVVDAGDLCLLWPGSKDGGAGSNLDLHWWSNLSRNKASRAAVDMAKVGVRPAWTQSGCPVLRGLV